MVKITHKVLVLGAVAMLTLTGMTGSVLARNGADDSLESSSSPQASASVQPSPRQTEQEDSRGRSSRVENESENESERASTSPRPDDSRRLTKAKRNVCEKKTKNVNKVMDRITERATAQLAVFTKISERTQAFYVSKGKVVVGYEALVAATVTAKQKAVSSIAALNATNAFTCDSVDPKGSVVEFKAKVKLVVADLKAYRTSVKNLIVAVKSVQSTEGDK